MSFAPACLVLMVVFSWLEPYVGQILPGQAEHPRAYAFAGDLLLLGSFFIFWDKLRALFIREAKAQFPAKAGA
jgi:membrane protease YdiL (CAAX protease family)